MKHFIYKISPKKDYFFCMIEGRRVGFYLTRSLYKVFSEHLEEGYLIDFEISDYTKRIGRTKFHQVSHFNTIESVKPYVVIYDIEKLRLEMRNVITQYDHYLFVDFEMTMPGYSRGPFQVEIIQFGASLTDKDGNTILDRNYYIKPLARRLSLRTIRFLDLDLDEFNANSKPYDYFYINFKNILDTYKPKIVVWGKNDIVALNESYKLHDLLPLTNEYDFFDLLTLHKDYFNLNQDIGLFKAYETYFPQKDVKQQKHNAKDDANITKKIFFEFLKEIKEQ